MLATNKPTVNKFMIMIDYDYDFSSHDLSMAALEKNTAPKSKIQYFNLMCPILGSRNKLNVGKVVNATADFAKDIFRKLGS